MKLFLSLALVAALSTNCFADTLKMSIHAKVNFIQDASNPNRYNANSADLDIRVKGKLDGQAVNKRETKQLTAEEMDAQYLLIGNNEVTSVDKDGSQETSPATIKDGGNTIEFSANKMIKVGDDGASASVQASKIKCAKNDSALNCSVDVEMKVQAE